ncbi:MAG: penicillin-binding protein 2 [Deltaproteobacteria bacterium]|nr:penicillin-binding protein 2 [Deltaproteobacteria bacterium]
MALRTDEVNKFRARFYALAFFAFLAFSAIVIRLWALQIQRGEEFTQKSEQNFVQEKRLIADRGLIFDGKGRLIVDNRPALDLYATPAFVRNAAGSLAAIGPAMQLTSEEEAAVLKRIKGARGLDRFQGALIRRDLSRDQLELIESQRMMGELAGFYISDSGVRDYRFGELLAHVTGYQNEIGADELERRLKTGDSSYKLGDLLGRRGLERANELDLRGKDGYERVVVDNTGTRQSEALTRELLGDDRRHEPLPGKNLVLSIDLDIQRAAEAAFTGQAGVVIAVEVDTGFIVALYSTPAYDPNRVTGRLAGKEKERLDANPLKPNINRAIQEHYAPGSTYKAFTALTALAHGLITPESWIPCPGYYKYGGNKWRCFKDSGHGGIQLHKSLVVSCDTYYYSLGAKLGVDALAETAKSFGFGRRTNVSLDQEIPGIVPTAALHDEINAKDGGYRVSMAINTSVGQGANAFTPLQLVMAYAAIANGGTLYEPQLVRRIEDVDGRVVKTYEPKVANKLEYKQEHWDAVRSGLCGVVNEAGGTAYGKRQPDLIICGKTGTAQVKKLKARVKDQKVLDYLDRDNAWFVGYAPGDAPKYAVVTLTEHGGFGGGASAPTVVAVLRAAIKGEFITKDTTKAELR